MAFTPIMAIPESGNKRSIIRLVSAGFALAPSNITVHTTIYSLIGWFLAVNPVAMKEENPRYKEIMINLAMGPMTDQQDNVVRGRCRDCRTLDAM